MGAEKYNVPLLKQVYNQINNEPRKHEQQLYASTKLLPNIFKKRRIKDPGAAFTVECPTTACVAGWAAHFSGAVLAFGEEEVQAALRFNRVSIETSWCVTRNGRVTEIDEFAANKLGLDREESNDLFSGSNTRQYVLRRLAALITAGEKAQAKKAKQAKKAAKPEPKAVKVEYIKSGQKSGQKQHEKEREHA